MKSKLPEAKELAYKAREKLFQLVTNDQIIKIPNTISRKELRELLNKQTYLVTLKCGEFDKYVISYVISYVIKMMRR